MVSLYPNLNVDIVVDRIRDEVLRTDLEFKNVDYLEATRYLVLNWTVEKARRSNLRRVLPIRRGKRGTKPGIRGEGPRGSQRGDQEQWEFKKNIILEDWEKKQILAEVVKIATEAMFKKHYYSFGGRTYHQRGGGPIGLRGTCAVARVIMQLFDRKWGQMLRDMGVRLYDLVRYMDDIRAILAPFKSGWRWVDGGIKYCKRWEAEDQELTPIERTRRIIAGTMGVIEPFLTFTTETEEDFEGWLPTLDTSIKVSKDNRIIFKFYEKPTNSNRTLDKRTALSENQKVTILAQEVIRRLGNTEDSLPKEDYVTILDRFSQKLYNSGYSEDQVRRIVLSGIKGWGGKVLRCKEEGRRLRRTAEDSLEIRMRTKLVGKSTWFKGRGANSKKVGGTTGKRSKKEGGRTTTSTPRSVLFVDYTPGGELAARLRELILRLEPTIGFSVKVVERSGLSLQSQFPLTTLWSGTSCGRTNECVTCYQGADMIPDCTKQSILYENVCFKCVPKAKEDKELRDEDMMKGEHPVLYVGETSRSVVERSKEHWSGYRGGDTDNHMVRHQNLVHSGEPAVFVMRVAGSYRSALSRQVGEAVRIRRRGGAGNILNSKSEYNRCHIPRLQVEDREEEEQREKGIQKDMERIEEELNKEQRVWEEDRTQEKDRERRQTAKKMLPGGAKGNKKRKEKDKGAPRSKRRRYDLLVGEWGAPVPREQSADPCTGSSGHLEQGAGDYPYSPSNTRQGELEQTDSPGTLEQGAGDHPCSTSSTRQGEPAERGFDKTVSNLVRRTPTLTQSSIMNFLVPTEREGRVVNLSAGTPYEQTVGDEGFGVNTTDGDGGKVTGEGDRQIETVPSGSVSDVPDTGGDELLLGDTLQTAPSVVGSTDKGGGTMSEDDFYVKQHDGGGTRSECDGGEDDMVGVCGGLVEPEMKIVDEGVSNNDVMISEVRRGVSCEFTKRGVCSLHKLKGDKITQKRKVWRKKKYGYGYVTISQVTYSCKGGMKPMNSETSIDSNEPNLSPVLTNEQGGSTSSDVFAGSDWITEGAVDQLNS